MWSDSGLDDCTQMVGRGAWHTSLRPRMQMFIVRKDKKVSTAG